MKKKTILILLLSLWGVNSFAEGLFKRYGYQVLSDFVQNPKMFFMDIQYNTEDVTPAWPKNTAVSTNIFMQLCTIANLNVKTEVLSAQNNVPQITAGLSGWYFWGLNLLDNIPDLKEAKNMQVYGFAPFVTVSYAADKEVDLFAGAKLSVGHVEMDFRQVVQNEIKDRTLRDMVQNVSYLNETYLDPALYVGMGVQTGEKSKIYAQVGYQFFAQRVFAKINFSGETFEWGIGFYPDSVFVIQPIANISIKFNI